MTRPLLGALIAILAYAAIYYGGQYWAYRDPHVSRLWAKAFLPLRKVQFHEMTSGLLVEKGTLRQNAGGHWSLEYDEPKATSPGDPYPSQAIRFRVPAHLAGVVKSSKNRHAQVEIEKELDPERFNYSMYVLKSVAPLP